MSATAVQAGPLEVLEGLEGLPEALRVRVGDKEQTTVFFKKAEGRAVPAVLVVFQTLPAGLGRQAQHQTTFTSIIQIRQGRLALAVQASTKPEAGQAVAAEVQAVSETPQCIIKVRPQAAAAAAAATERLELERELRLPRVPVSQVQTDSMVQAEAAEEVGEAQVHLLLPVASVVRVGLVAMVQQVA